MKNKNKLLQGKKNHVQKWNHSTWNKNPIEIGNGG